MVSGAKSYMRKGFLIYEESANFSPYMRMPLDFAPDPSEFPYIFYISALFNTLVYNWQRTIRIAACLPAYPMYICWHMYTSIS